MAKNYENKADHNQDFLDSLVRDYENFYFDWKVTVQFYIALHRSYCILISKGLSISTSHKTNISELGNIERSLGISLNKLFTHSRQSRYEGFLTPDAMERINKINFNNNIAFLAEINSKVSNYYPIPA
ncbi:MAG: hypothetical protein DI548_03830 [Flavobacterium johnsoniae]|nr:MAG: hypothetical protein DI548_03830 [Flavobacterium johnsoniae]